MQESVVKNVPKGLVVIAMVNYLLSCPYTKVEESFNIQAMHDLLYHSTNISKYDHHEFPGVVPRSFIGPVFISPILLPSVNIFSLLGFKKFAMQYWVRFWTGCTILYGLFKFSTSLRDMFGSEFQRHFLLITATQFHFLFYISRPLPNTFALILVLPALSAWLQKDIKKFIWLSAFVIIVFRFEIFILMGICLLISILNGHISIKDVFIHAIPAGLFSLTSTVAIDSYFWQRLVWPEGEVAWFNIILNKSGQWGTEPFSWYFTSVLPRALLTSTIFLPWGLRCDRRCLLFFIPALSFVLAFSLLPHKELRFIIYTFPLFNVVAARAYTDLSLRFRKSIKWRLLYVFAILCLLVNVALSSIFLAASTNNYPGGEMMEKLHEQVPCDEAVHIHIANYAAQTGVTRFTQTCPQWRYNKTENLNLDHLRSDTFSHVIAEHVSSEMGSWEQSHVQLATTSVFSSFAIQRTRFNIPFPVMRTSPALVLWQRKSFPG